MPTYEYLCKTCGHTWEAQQRISDNPLTECPSCHQPTAQRQISAGNFILKGGGWYADLYSSSPKKKTEKSETKSETKADSASAPAKTESSASSTTTSSSTEKKSTTPPPAVAPKTTTKS